MNRAVISGLYTLLYMVGVWYYCHCILFRNPDPVMRRLWYFLPLLFIQICLFLELSNKSFWHCFFVNLAKASVLATTTITILALMGFITNSWTALLLFSGVTIVLIVAILIAGGRHGELKY